VQEKKIARLSKKGDHETNGDVDEDRVASWALTRSMKGLW